MTEFLVRRTLAPLVRGATPDRILSLRVVDPSMGSGAFLVAACRFLAGAYEDALVAEGTVARADISQADRAAFRRAGRAALPLRRRLESHGRPTGAPVAVAVHARRRSPAHLPRSSPARAATAWPARRCATSCDRPAAGERRGRGGNSRRCSICGELETGLSSAVGVRLGVARRAGRLGRGGPSQGTRDRAARRRARPAARLARRRRRLVRGVVLARRDRTAGRTGAGRRSPPALRGTPDSLPRGLEERWRTTAARIAARERFLPLGARVPRGLSRLTGARRARTPASTR